MDGNIKTHNQDPKGNMDEGGEINESIFSFPNRMVSRNIIRNKKALSFILNRIGR